MSNKEYLGQTVQMIIDGHRATVLLYHYDEAADTLDGVAFYEGMVAVQHDQTQTKDARINYLAGYKVKGCRPYPYDERPNYKFQFVANDADVQPLLDIGHAGTERNREAINEQPVQERIDQVLDDTPDFDPEDLNQDGTVTNKERKEYRKQREGEGR